MNIAITGATGFIGEKLVNAQLKLGNSVRVLTRGNRFPAGIPDDIQVFYGDLTDKSNDLSEFVRGVDVLFHCAAELNDESKMHMLNVEGTLSLMRAANNNIKHWVQLSSTGVYGNPLKSKITENTEADPHNAYETSKLISDKLLLENNVINKTFTYTILRPSNVYGGTMTNQSLFQLIRSVDCGCFFFIGKKGASANYIYVDNVVSALVECGRNKKAQGKVFILSDMITMESFILLISKYLKKPEPRIRFPKLLVQLGVVCTSIIPGIPLSLNRVNALSNRSVYISDYIKKELSFDVRVSMEEGISRLVKVYLEMKNK